MRRYRIKRENFEIRSDEDVLRYNARVEAYIFNMPDSEFDESMSELIDYEVSDEQVKKRAEEIVKRLNDGEDRYDVLYGKDRVLYPNTLGHLFSFISSPASFSAKDF